MKWQRKKTIWENLRDDKIVKALHDSIPLFQLEMPLEEIRKITNVFSRIVDSKSNFTRRHSKGLAEKAAKMADYYKKDETEKTRLIIAADLHDLGEAGCSKQYTG